MHEWLQDEMNCVNTNKFFVTNIPSTQAVKQIDQDMLAATPPSYRAFSERYGNSALYRMGGQYLVRIFAVPSYVAWNGGDSLLYFGRTDLALAYFKKSMLIPGEESPVFEWRNGLNIAQVANGCEDWIKSRCHAARKMFTRKQWQEIKSGPPPFTRREQEIVAARSRYKWRVIGVSGNGDIQFEVHNGSDMILPFLSIGVRGKNGRVDGGVWLPVSSIMPGHSSVIEKDCYKDIVPAGQIEVFEKPPPGPEDRDRYWEFRDG